jgi:hypothetical protein
VDHAFVQTHAFPGESTIFGGDFDQDGRDDLVSVWNVSQVRVRYGSPSGPATPHQTLTLPPLAGFDEIVFHPSTGDANGDGFTDLLLTTVTQIWGGHGGRLIDRSQHSLYLGSAAGLASAPALTLPGGSFGEADFVFPATSRHAAHRALCPERAPPSRRTNRRSSSLRPRRSWPRLPCGSVRSIPPPGIPAAACAAIPARTLSAPSGSHS